MLIDKKRSYKEKKLLNVCECVYKWVCDKKRNETGRKVGGQLSGSRLSGWAFDKTTIEVSPSFRRTHNELCARLPFSPFRHHCGKFQCSAKDSSSPTHTHTHTPTSRQIDKVAIFIFTYWENEPKKGTKKKEFKEKRKVSVVHGTLGPTMAVEATAKQQIINFVPIKFCAMSAFAFVRGQRKILHSQRWGKKKSPEWKSDNSRWPICVFVMKDDEGEIKFSISLTHSLDDHRHRNKFYSIRRWFTVGKFGAARAAKKCFSPFAILSKMQFSASLSRPSSDLKLNAPSWGRATKQVVFLLRGAGKKRRKRR